MKFPINLRSTPKFKRPELLFWPGIPMPLQGVNPRTIMGRKAWDELRREVYEVNNDCCWACGVHRSKARPSAWLEAHEVYDVDYKKGKMTLREIVALCPLCHKYVHKGRLKALLEARKIQRKLYNAVITHGDELLRKSGAKPWFNAKKIARQARKYRHPWRKWYLVYNGKRYHSRFGNATEYTRYYAKLGTKE